MSELSKVVDGGTSASAAAALDVSAASALVDEGGGGITPEGASLGHEGSTLK